MEYITKEIVEWTHRIAATKKMKKRWFVDADTIASDALYKVVKAIQSGAFVYESEKKLKYYIDRAITTAACTLMQKAAARNHFSLDAEDEDNNKFNEPIFEDQREQIEELRDELEPYVKNLKPERRKAIELTLGGYKPRNMVDYGFFESARVATKTKHLAIKDVKDMITVDKIKNS